MTAKSKPSFTSGTAEWFRKNLSDGQRLALFEEAQAVLASLDATKDDDDRLTIMALALAVQKRAVLVKHSLDTLKGLRVKDAHLDALVGSLGMVEVKAPKKARKGATK